MTINLDLSSFQWLHTASTNQGLALLALTAAGYLQGTLTRDQALTAIVGAIVSIILPQKTPTPQVKP